MSENSPEEPGENQQENYGAYSVDDEDQLQQEDTLVDRGLDDALDEGYSAPEKGSAGQGVGNTPYAQQAGGSATRPTRSRWARPSTSASRRRCPSPTPTRRRPGRPRTSAVRSAGLAPGVWSPRAWTRTS